MIKRVELKIHGRVQGVFYRDSARRRANKLGVIGCAKNESDGTVFIVAEGEEETLKKFIEWCYNGPILAKVTRINVQWKQVGGEYKKFDILH